MRCSWSAPYLDAVFCAGTAAGEHGALRQMAGFDPNAPMNGFDPNAMMGYVDPNAGW